MRKWVNRLLGIIVMVFVSLCLCFIPAQAAESESGVDWSFNGETGKLTIESDIGAVDFRNHGCGNVSVRENTVSAEFADQVTKLQPEMLAYHFSKLKTVKLSKNITEIPYRCFYQCTALQNINLENVTKIAKEAFEATAFDYLDLSNVTSLGDYAFYQCPLLEKVKLDKLSAVGRCVFAYSPSLAVIDFGNSTAIGENMVKECNSIENILIKNATEFGNYPFENCNSLKSIEITKLTTLDEKMFYGNSALETVKMPSVTTIKGNVFKNQKKLKSCSFPKVVSIGSYAFSGCIQLTTLDFPSVTSADSYAFSGCTKVNSIKMPLLKRVGNYAFSNCENLLVVDLPKVTKIGASSFASCILLEKVNLPFADELPYNTFHLCTNLLSVSVPQATSVDNYAFNGCSSLETLHLEKIESIGNNLSIVKDSLKAIYFGSSAASEVNLNAFSCADDQIVYFPAGTNMKLWLSKLPADLRIQVGTNSADFIERIYTNALERPSEANGKSYWVNQLDRKEKSGAETGYGFVFSEEYLTKNESDEQFLTMLYTVFMNRVADAGGIGYWKENMAKGMSWEEVYKCFAESAEYRGICSDYNILSGTVTLPEPNQRHYSKDYKGNDPDTNVGNFVERCYQTVLNRGSEPDGFAYWKANILAGNLSPYDMAIGFVHSQEFVNRNLTDAQYIDVLYTTFFNRASDDTGRTYWLNFMASGASKDTVMLCFANTEEFAAVLKSYGL